MYNITVDNDKLSVPDRVYPAISILELIGEEPNDCVLVSLDNIVFRGDVDLSLHAEFKTIHQDFIPDYWDVVF